MPNIGWNKATWDGAYDWSQAGDEWSGPWGNSTAMWFATIMPRIAMALTDGAVLEIAPGHGRCTQFLLRFARLYQGIDLSAQCVAFCRERFAGHAQARFHQNDGRSLDVVAGDRFDLVFSFDSLVHADMDAIAAYVPQLVTLLRPGGIAFIHHSNLAAYPNREWQHRSLEISAENVAELVERHGGRVLIQELFGGDGSLLPDCFTIFCRAGEHAAVERRIMHNPDLMSIEGRLALEVFGPYLALGATS